MVAKGQAAGTMPVDTGGLNILSNNSKKQLITGENIKTDFYEKEDEKIVLTIYIKNLASDHHIDFTETQIRINFRTSDTAFLKQHTKSVSTDDYEKTFFEWNIDLANRINPSQSKYTVSKFKLELHIVKHDSAIGKWKDVIKTKEVVSNLEKSTSKQENKLLNEKIIKIRSPSPLKRRPTSLNEPPPDYSNAYYGFIGLQNLGNTCYMNAALQSLANLTDLRDYLVEASSSFKKEINTNNALGLNGKMAISMALLMRKLWKEAKPFLSPNHLRDILCTKYAHFRGYEQQDTHEFMCSLLSILHEDLNRVLKKPFYESNLECSTDLPELTSKVACDSWQRFLSRENSFITDKFYGQFKSKLICPVCAKVSITFEPFSTLLVPLPCAKQICDGMVITRNKQPVKVKLFVDELDTAAELLEKLRERFEDLKNKSLSLFVLNQRSAEVDDEVKLIGFGFDQNWENIPSKSKVSKLKANQIFVIYEIDDSTCLNEPILELRVQQLSKYPNLLTKSLNQCSFCKACPTVDPSDTAEPTKKLANLQRCTRCFRSAYCNSECQKSDWQRHSTSICSKPLDVVGVPLVLTFRLSELTEFDEKFLKNKLYEYSTYSSIISNYNENRLEINLVEINDAAAILSKNLNKLNPLNTSELLENFKNSGLSQHVVRLQIKWNNAYTSVSKNQLKIVTNLDGMKDMTKMREIKTNLHDCMKLFTEPETLTSENPWYCSNCKEHQKAHKQMSLWNLPEYLIITLKRFHANKASDAPHTSNIYLNYLIQNRLAYNKLNTFIEYPLKNLNMSKYISDPTNKTPYIYDLCSVINHIGQSLYLGHYTAFARTHDKLDSSQDELGWRHFDDADVQPVNNLDHIVTQDAYVLIYRLRASAANETTTTETEGIENMSLNYEAQRDLAEVDRSSSGDGDEDEYFNLESDESAEINSESNGSSSESLNVNVDGSGENEGAFTNLNDID